MKMSQILQFAGLIFLSNQ